MKPVVDAYLAEGFDIDAEGAYIEHSSGIYDSVCDRSLLLIADHWDCPSARPTVAANLNFDLHLLHADGTMETGLSRRQDYGTAVVPLGLAACYLHYAAVIPNPLFVAAARRLWAKGDSQNAGVPSGCPTCCSNSEIRRRQMRALLTTSHASSRSTASGACGEAR